MFFTPQENINLNFNATILTIEVKDNTNKLTVKINNNKAIVYIDKSYDVKVGDYGYFKCSESSYTTNPYNGSFDYKEYLYNSYISGVYFVNDYTYIKNKFVISKVQQFFYNKLSENLDDETLKYSLMLILGIDTFTDEENETLSNLGIMHLFCISGMHINFILMLVSFVLSKYNLSKNKIEIVQVIFALLLMIITNFSISVTRAFLMFFIAFLCRRRKIDISSLDVLCISAIIMLIFRPRYLYLVSFQLTYLVTFMIILTTDLYKDKSMIKSILLQSLVAFATTFPIIVNINYEINLLTVLYSTFISIPFSYVIMPITFVSSIFSLNIFNYIYVIFDSILSSLGSIDMFIFKVSRLSMIAVIAYYVVMYFLLKSIYLKKHIYKFISLLLAFLFIVINFSSYDHLTTVTYFDVGMGDSSLISLSHNKGNILIDAYGGVSNFIKTRGIKNIDYVIITHAHNDHMADLEDVQKNFNVSNTVCSLYDQESKKLNCDSYVKANDKITLDNVVIEFIAPYESHSDINRASLVFKVYINDYIFMYTGDTTKEIEAQMINLGIDLYADVLKVPHHGSNTSSSIEFVNSVNPKYSIFSYGKKNNYGIPHLDVVNRYNNTISYHTAIDGHIEFYYFKEWKVRFYN